MTPEILRSLDDAYAIFARYPMPNYLGLSGAFQLRDLTSADWENLDSRLDLGVLMYSDGGAMLRYFLPRWLQWLSEENNGFRSYAWELWDLGYRLIHFRWRTWPADEVAALRALFEAWTRAEISRNNGAPPALWQSKRTEAEDETLGLSEFTTDSELLRFLGEIGEAALYLELWLDCNLLQLARWLWSEDLRERKNARLWVVSSRLESEFEAAFFANPDGENAELFSRSIELIRSLRAL